MNKQKRKVPKWIYWTPRVLSIIFICFLALFSLDVFEPGLTAGQIALGLFMHNIPVIVLAILLWISWKYEIVGGIAFILGGLTYIAFIIFNIAQNGFEGYYLAWAVQFSGIAFFIGILFMMNWYKKKK